MMFFRLAQLISLALIFGLLQACAQSMPEEVLEQKYVLPSSKFIEVDGNRVHVSDQGQGEVVILIHGTASSLHAWNAWSDILVNNYRVVRMDLPGFGLTGPDHQNRYEVKDDVKFLDGLMSALDIDQAHIVGSSLGGRIAWEFSLDHSDKVSSLTLINSLGYEQESWPPAIQAAQWPVFDSLMTKVSPRFMYEVGLADVYFDTNMIDDALVDRYFELSRYPGNLEAFPNRVKARLDDESQKISEISVPTLVIWGQEDMYFPVESGHNFHRDIKDSKLVIYPEIGHLPMEETPRDSADDFIAFIQALPSIK